MQIFLSTAHHGSIGWWVNPSHFEPPRCDRNRSRRSQHGRDLFPIGDRKWIKQQQANAHPADEWHLLKQELSAEISASFTLMTSIVPMLMSQSPCIRNFPIASEKWLQSYKFWENALRVFLD